MKITFLHHGTPEMPPVAASDEFPEWYEKTEPYIDGHKRHGIINGQPVTTATIKKCIPVFDMLTAGYLIKTWADIEIYYENDIAHYKIEQNILAGHNVAQVKQHPEVTKKDDVMPKIINRWAIKTSPGSSCLFIPPAHRKNIISILPAIVDTDSFNLPVHFPFTITDRTFSGIIPKGTVIAQVIPFVRNEWNMSYEAINEIDAENHFKRLHEKPFNAYRDRFWSKRRDNDEKS